VINSIFPGTEKIKLWYLFIFMLITGVFEVFGLASIAPFLGIVADPDLVESNELINLAYSSMGFTGKNDFIIFIGLFFLVVIIITSTLNVFLNWKINSFVQYSTARLAQLLLNKYLCMPYTFFLNIHSSEISKNILNEVARAVELVIYPSLHALSKLVVTLFIVLLLFLVNPEIALTTFLVFSFFYLLIFKYLKKKIEIIGEAATAAISDRFKVISETIAGIKEIKLKRMEKQCCLLFKTPSENFAQYVITRHLFAEIPKALIEIVTFTLIILIIIYLMLAESDSGNRISIIALYGFAAYRLMPAVQLIFNNVTQIKFNFSSLKALSDRLVLMDGNANYVKNSVPLDFPNKVEIKELSYCYPGTKEKVLDKVSLAFNPGMKVGLVGESGSGKSTLVDIILGLLELQSGEIILGNVKLSAENTSTWQEYLSYVPQNIFLFDGTVEQNIAFSLGQDSIDKERIQTVISQSVLNEFINDLPDKENTLVGERGVRISGGQKQRIGIARALYKKSNLLILDEATSAIDSINERKIIDTITTLPDKPAVIMIAHRISTVRNCDIIYVLKKGKIIASGSYDYLLSNCDYFKNLSN